MELKTFHQALQDLNEAASLVAKLAPANGIERTSDHGYHITGICRISNTLVDCYAPSVEVVS